MESILCLKLSTKGKRALALLWSWVFILNNCQAAVFYDGFDDSTVDTTQWATFTSSTNSQVFETGGRLILSQRGGLITVATVATNIQVRGRFRFTGSGDHFRVGLRTDGSTFPPESEPTGMFVGFRQDDNTLGIAQAGVQFLDNKVLGYTNGVDVDFRITDINGVIRVYVNGASSPFVQASSSYRTGSKVMIYDWFTAGTQTEVDFIEISEVVQDNSLIVHYRFENDGINEVGPSLTLQPTSISYTNGVRGLAAVFNGSSSSFATTDVMPITGNQSRTLAAWVNLQSFNQKRRLMTWGDVSANGRLSGVVVDSDGSVVFHNHNRDAHTVPNLITLQKWHHIAVSYGTNLTNVSIYVNGTLANIAFIANHPEPGNDQLATATNSTFRVGLDPLLPAVDWNRAWHGLVDDLRVYSRRLTQNEILEVYNEIMPQLSIHHAVEIEWQGSPALNYQLEYSTNLSTGFPADAQVFSSNGVFRFYRRTVNPSESYRVRLNSN
jgi:Concanavalin A-like lectin/glucanases superfamily